jgi:C-terminal processing protease CtpA/Prc
MAPARQIEMPAAARARAGFTRVERLSDNVGYIELDHFAPVDAACSAADAAMDFLADADALVIDLRRNDGGDRRMAALLTSYLFDTEPVHLHETYARPSRGGSEPEAAPGGWARRYLRNDVFLLTGRATSPLAREFSRNLERLRGARIVDEAA